MVGIIFKECTRVGQDLRVGDGSGGGGVAGGGGGAGEPRKPNPIPCMAASAGASGLMDSARHVNKRILNPRFLSEMASYDVSSSILQSRTDG